MASTVAGEITRPAKPEASQGSEMSPSGVSEQEEREVDAVNAGRHVRKMRILTNVLSLGEIYLVGNDHVPAHTHAQEADSVLMSDSVTVVGLRVIKSYCAAMRLLSGEQLASWSGVRLLSEGRREWCLLLLGVTPIKSRYVYRRKYNRDGSIKKNKARLVALSYGQVSGVEVFNIFALVVNITVRLVLSLAFIFYMHVHHLDVSNAFCYANIEGNM